MSLLTRLFGKTVVSPEHQYDGLACVEWAGCTSEGYGQIWFQGKMVGTHRVAWEVVHGDIPKGLWVLHHCDNPPCLRTEHLFVGDQFDNMQDRSEKDRVNAAWGEALPAHKLAPELVRNIRKDYESGLVSYKGLGKKYGVSASTAGKAAKGLSWRRIPS